jgi:hypothetical protein
MLVAGTVNAQLQTGNIYGKVQVKDGGALPGVTVTLRGVGAPQIFITDDQGKFHFLNLSPGTYSIAAELANFGSMVRSGVTVNVGRNADVAMTLDPKIVDKIIIVADEPLLDRRKTGDGTTVGKIELERVPTSRDPWGVLGTAAGVQVDRINVGGSQSGQQSVYIGKGAGSAQNSWSVDGVTITDMAAMGSTPLYFDFDSLEEMQVATGGSDPRIQTPGVQLNLVTKRGTNDIRGSGRYFYTPGSLQADASVPDEALTYLDKTNAIHYVRDFGVELGGPIWADHLWMWYAGSENKISNQASITKSDTGVAGGAFDDIILRDKNAKLNAQIAPSNSAVGFYTFGDKVRNARNLGPTRTFPSAWHQSGPTKVYKIEDTQIVGNSLYLTGMWSKVSGGFSLIPNGGRDASAVLDSSGVWHNSFIAAITERPQKQGRLDGSKFFDLGSTNHELKFGFGYRHTPVTSVSSWGGAANGFIRQRPNSYCAAASRNIPNTTHCMQAVLTRDKVASFDEKYNDFYAGDTILAGNLTVQAGIRWDKQRSLNTASTAAANPIIGSGVSLPCTPSLAGVYGPCASGPVSVSLPTLTFAGDSRTFSWSNVSPRIGLTYALGADKKTLIRAGYNRYVNQLGSAVSGASPVGYTSYAYFVGDDVNNDQVIQSNELLKFQNFFYFDPAHPTALTSSTRLDYNAKAPHSDELIFGGERELMTDFTLGVNYTYRKYRDLIVSRAEKTQGVGDWYTRNDYELVGKTDPDFYTCAPGVAVCDASNAINSQHLPQQNIYDLKSGVPIPQFFVVTNRPDYSQKYQGVELTATKRLSHKWMLRANATWNDWTESCGAESVANPTPALGNCPGGQVTERSAGSGAFQNVFISSKWSANLTGLYQLPWSVSLGASVTARQGYPRPFRQDASAVCGTVNGHTDTTCDVNALANVLNTDTTVVIQPIGTTRFANVYEVDLRAAKDFRLFDKVGVTLSADLFNVPNQRTVLQRQTVMDMVQVGGAGTGDRITELQSPRVWRLGAKITF